MRGEHLRTQLAKRAFKRAFRAATHEASVVLDEAAFPAYAHMNPFIDKVFWGRLSAAERYLSKRKPLKVLDFGCGSGVMSYIVGGFAEQVVATDIQPEPLRRMQESISFPRSVVFVGPTELSSPMYRRNFDAIIALDVLEHVQQLSEVLDQFQEMLRPGGVAIISGPTENALYKVGRRFAGRRFTGDYHVSNIGLIEKECRRRGSVPRSRAVQG